MQDLTLGRVLGECLASTDGLTYVHVPDGIPIGVAAELVRGANVAHPASPPFAILVVEGAEDLSDPDCLRVAPQTTIQYRKGDHLAVVYGRQPELASFVQTFREVLGQSYPIGASGPVSLDHVSETVLRILQDELKLPPMGEADSDYAVARMAHCLELLAESHQALAGGSRSWNSNWFEHVSRGLATLEAKIRELMWRSPDITVAHALGRYIFPSFGLPQPDGKGSKLTGASIAKALETSWSNEDSMETAAKQLAFHHQTPEGQPHPLQDLDFRGIDLLAAASDSLLLALGRKIGEAPSNVEAMSHLTESQFLQPEGDTGLNPKLDVRSVDGRWMTLEGLAPSGPYFVPVDDTGAGTLLSSELRIRIPTLGAIDTESLDSSLVSLRCSQSKTTWVGRLEKGADGELSAVGRISVGVGVAKASLGFGSSRLSVHTPVGDPLAGQVVGTAMSEVYLFPRDSTFAAYAPQMAKGRLGKFKYVGPQNLLRHLADDEVEHVAAIDSSRPRFRLAVWHPVLTDKISLDGVEMDPDGFLPEFRTFDLVPSGNDTVLVANQTFTLRSAEDKKGHQSALLAAAGKQHVTPERPSPNTVLSIRGQFEEYLKDAIQDQVLLSALGHVVVPQDQPVGLDGIRDFRDGAFLMHPDAWPLWAGANLFKVNKSFIEGAEATRFRSALAALDLARFMNKATDDGQSFREWPSRTFWRALWADGEALREYLDSYVSLVEAARQTYDPFAVFWATYPMSISVWGTGHASGCKAVLLSPLHPVRLAWLAGVEHTLFEAHNAEGLAGTIEGWNLPLIGPRETNNGRLIAVPIDSGEDQIFLGWSMMVAASIDGFESLSAPQRAGNFTIPGSAVSGLNGPAAAAALRSYRSMHPHLSTLTVDLAAGAKTPRLAEVDEAVLSAVQEWTKGGSSGLVGGARVWDSLFREGNAPRDEVTRLVRSNPDLLLTWSRYEPDANLTRACNVRFLQDAGTKIEVSNGPHRYGSMGPVPLRRFEGYVPPLVGSETSVSHPAIDHGTGWPPFVDALNAIEAAGPAPQIATRLFNSLLVDERADWTVSGESMLSASAIAALVKDSAKGSQMLWEWRPPYLDKNEDVPLLERRPFISVARVPSSFESQLEKLLVKAQGGTSPKDQVKELIGKLGSRGVGLSALLSMGGTHAAGAVGFYLAFSMLDAAHPGDIDQFVLPIDASDTFLRVLSDEDKHGGPNRRADLLLVRIDEGGVVLVPVEVKCYGLQAETSSGTLPEAGSHALNESLDQLSATHQLLQRLAVQALQIGSKSRADSLLWMNGLATLLETGARLQPISSGQPERLARRLGALAAGELPVRVGRPLITYFKHASSAADGAAYSVVRSSTGALEAGFEYGALIADIGHAFDEIKSADGSMTQAFAETIEWAVSSSADPTLASVAKVASGSTSVRQQPALLDPTAGVNSEGNNLDTDSPEGERKTFEPADVNGPEDVAGRGPDQGSEVEAEGQIEEHPALGIADEGVKFSVGSTIETLAAAPVYFWPSNTGLNQMNIGVVGDLGTGKTEFLKALVAQLREQAKDKQAEPLNVLIFDFKGDFQRTEFLSRVGGRVLEPRDIPLNIFGPVTEEHSKQPYQQAAAFVDILKRIYSGVGVVQSENLNQVIRDLFEESGGEPPTLAEVRDRYAEQVQKPDSVISILNSFVYGRIFSSVKDDLMTFSEIIEDRVLVVALDKLGNDQQAKNAVVALFLNVYYDYMIKSEKLPFQGKDPQLRYLKSFLLTDEAVNVMAYEFPVLMNLMLQGRQFGFGIVLASQYLSHFKQGSQNYGQPLLTWCIHKVPAVSAKELEQLGLPGLGVDVAGRIPVLKQHEALYKSYGSEAGRFIRVHPYYELYRD